jgi:hypothetical protein
VAAVLALVCSKPGGSDHSRHGKELRGLLAVAALWLALGLPAGLAARIPEAIRGDDSGEFIREGEYVVLDPQAWIGKRFPLREHIDVGPRITRGIWLVLLYKHACPACQEAVSQYSELARAFAGRSEYPSIALVECPPYGADNSDHDGRLWLKGHLSETKKWYVDGPVALLLDEGRVRNVFDNARDIELVKAIWTHPEA